MSTATSSLPKTFIIRRGTTEMGPFTIAQLNQMRGAKQLLATDFCAPSETGEFRPLFALFPHMAEFTVKTPAQHKKEAAAIQGNLQANTSLLCGALSWVIATPICATLAIVFGIRSWCKAKNIQSHVGVFLGATSLVFWLMVKLKHGF